MVCGNKPTPFSSIRVVHGQDARDQELSLLVHKGRPHVGSSLTYSRPQNCKWAWHLSFFLWFLVHHYDELNNRYKKGDQK